MAFLRNLLAVIVGLFIFTFLGFFMFVGIVASLGQEKKPTIPDNAVLHLKMSGVIMEQVAEDPFQELLPNSSVRSIGLIYLLKTINAAKSDDKIKGIYIQHGFVSGGFASLKEIRDAIIDFKESGKFVYSYAEYLGEADYYLASVADSVFLHPEGGMEINGLSSNITFWKGMFDKLEIEPVIFRVGQFKSYVEPFQQKKMSAENRLQITSLLNSVYDNYLEEVSASRSLTKERLKEISDELLVQVPTDAVSLGLIDRLVYDDEVIELLKSQVNVTKTKDLKLVSESKYLKAAPAAKYSKNKVAVIVAEGEIVMGGGDDVIVGEKIAKEIREARESESVKAIVLRVNSPGGSLTASDQIWREVQLTKGVKPIIASMSDVAASGGYYISMLCDTIVAQPNTVTGSIGIFGMWFNFEKFLENKIGITHDVVNTGKYSDIFTVTRPLSNYEKAAIQKTVDKGYQTFITKAAQGRNVTPDYINQVGGGRVWSGTQAKENGLVDVMGSLQDAIELAATKAGVNEDYKAVYYPVKKAFFEQIIEKLGQEAKIRLSIGGVNEFTKVMNQVNTLQRMQGVQARLPFDVSFE